MKKKLLLSLCFLALINAVSFAQDRIITGKVSDETGSISGISVTVKGTNRSTNTDQKGLYKITVPQNGKILVFTAVGFRTIEQVIGSSTSINVKLETSAEQLGEVVITALE